METQTQLPFLETTETPRLPVMLAVTVVTARTVNSVVTFGETTRGRIRVDDGYLYVYSVVYTTMA